jgi:hypothetical protein
MGAWHPPWRRAGPARHLYSRRPYPTGTRRARARQPRPTATERRGESTSRTSRHADRCDYPKCCHLGGELQASFWRSLRDRLPQIMRDRRNCRWGLPSRCEGWPPRPLLSHLCSQPMFEVEIIPPPSSPPQGAQRPVNVRRSPSSVLMMGCQPRRLSLALLKRFPPQVVAVR